LKDFDEYLEEDIVKKATPDIQRAKNLIKELDRKMASIFEQLEKIGLKNENANDYVEGCYDALIYLIRAKLIIDGYFSSGKGAHEAEVSYLRILDISEENIQLMDDLRFFRNKILYYGKMLDLEYAQKILKFSEEMRKILKHKINI
jgi:hypothetical protein